MGKSEILPLFLTQIGFQYLQKAGDPQFFLYILKAKIISIKKTGFLIKSDEPIFRYTDLIEIGNESIFFK
jgi:hypothetical protein